MGLVRTPSESGGHSARLHILSGALAGALEIVIFHPVDTAAKRLMVDQSRINSMWSGGNQGLNERVRAANSIIFRQAGGSMGSQLSSLYPGLSFAMLYKTMQRGFQYSVQPWVASYFAAHHREAFVQCCGPRYARTSEQAVAGAVMGCGEVLFLPIDSLKVKRQTDCPLSFAGAASDGWLATLRGSYRGGLWMGMRNAIGSFVLFGGAAFTKESILGLEDLQHATLREHFISSIAASVLCVWISGPFDVIKTRVQRQGGVVDGGAISADGRPRNGLQIVRDLATHEGAGAFFKGSIPKCAMVAPKVMFTYSVANRLYTWFRTLEDGK